MHVKPACHQFVNDRLSLALNIICDPFGDHILKSSQTINGSKASSVRILFRIFLNPPLFFFSDTASTHTHPVNSAANPDIFESAFQSEKN